MGAPYIYDISRLRVKHENSMYSIENLILNSDLRSESINTIFYYTDPIISYTVNINVTKEALFFM